MRPCVASACLAVLLAVPAAHAAEKTPPSADTVRAAPLHLVVLNDRMRMQVPYFGPAGVPTVMSNTMPAGALLAGNLIGGLVVAGIEHQRLKEARASVRPAYDLLREGQCLLDGGEAFMDALAPVAAGDAGSVPARHVLAAKQGIDDVISAKDERHLLLISYALTPELDYLLTTVHAMYAPAGEGGRNSRIAWEGQLTVAAPAPALPAKSPADIERLVEAENQAWIDSGNAARVKAANGGDLRARREVAGKFKQHEDALKQARAPEWSLRHASLENARAWTADGCGLLRQALRDNAAQAAALLPSVYAGDLPAFPQPGFWKMPPIPEETRDGITIRPSGPVSWLTWPAGRPMPGRHPSSAWMLDDGDQDKAEAAPETPSSSDDQAAG